MADLWMQGYEDVYASRRSRHGGGWFKKASSHAYYALLQAVASVEIQQDTGDFRLLDRKCVQALQQLRESERNAKTLVTGIDVPGYASTMVIMLLLGGIQLLSLGIMGEYIARIFNQTKGRPNYLVEKDDGRVRQPVQSSQQT